MARIAAACLLSLLLYAVLFGMILDRPLSHGMLRAGVDAAILRGEAIGTPKLVILAGSNGPYSHRCETIEPILARPCVNAGVAVGIGLDYLFARWRTLLRAGDVVYLPLEQVQYSRTRSATALGPDAAIMLRHDRDTLARLPADRWLGALFAFDLRALVMSLIEQTLLAAGFHDPRAGVTGGTNAWGDHVGHTAARAAANEAILAAAGPVSVSAASITQGDGTRIVAAFLAWANANGVRVVGGLPTGFADAPLPDATLDAIQSVYRDGGAEFLMLPNRSRYPRSWFFDTPDHLHEDAQIAHSRLVAHALRRLLDQRGPQPDGVDLVLRAAGSSSPR
ncbi:MAG: hypothetical protein AB7F35_14635 [Acetobacteraceae bacterium]